jgi:GDP/UDP-N,N'-diacetylbacillosamine 2-epimerase (hydrolysing)
MKKICVVTGSRAEYGLLKPLMTRIKKEPGLKLKLVVTGMHLSPEFGSTYKEIEKDGFKIDSKVNIGLTRNTPEGVANSTGLAISGIAKAYKALDPDIVVLLGDRFEIFAAAAAALISRRIIAHIHGGELTLGAIDDAFRHSITKMSHIHFTSTEEYRKRVIQLGEDPKRVYNVGALGLDNIKNMKLLSKKELEKRLGFTFGKRNLLVTFHPVTLEKDAGVGGFKNLLGVLDKTEDTKLIFTKANADPGGKIINKMIDSYVKKNRERAIVFASMGQLNYLSAMRYVDAVIGNSSSGIIEAPGFGVPAVDIGNRQEGRVKPVTVVSANNDERSIVEAINIALDKKFSCFLRNIKNPYDKGVAARRMVGVILKTDEKIIRKKFYSPVFVK